MRPRQEALGVVLEDEDGPHQEAEADGRVLEEPPADQQRDRRLDDEHPDTVEGRVGHHATDQAGGEEPDRRVRSSPVGCCADGRQGAASTVALSLRFGGDAE